MGRWMCWSVRLPIQFAEGDLIAPDESEVRRNRLEASQSYGLQVKYAAHTRSARFGSKGMFA